MKAIIQEKGREHPVPALLCLLADDGSKITEDEVTELSWCANQMNSFFSEMTTYDVMMHVMTCAERYDYVELAIRAMNLSCVRLMQNEERFAE